MLFLHRQSLSWNSQDVAELWNVIFDMRISSVRQTPKCLKSKLEMNAKGDFF